eukprot:TRINITY_DN14219_c0_g1_i1.p1 TRINITY_DN14219_c0_g1~~TRINITY_DN14219_c0_g1_i1.p1  ORF type:complete len:243 (-),score=34.80 TRINITY_DN14219_c0_g1_i1:15-743(-)
MFLNTIALFNGCLLFTFAPLLSLFVFLIANNGLMMILSIGGAFFWMVGMLLSGFVWFAIPPLRNVTAWSILIAVLIQEGMRYIFYRLLAKGQNGITKSKLDFLDGKIQHFKASLCCGVGAAIGYASVMYLGVIWDSRGQGTLFSKSCSHISVFVISSFLSTAFVLLQICWYIISFQAYKTKNWLWVAIVAVSHLVASYLTMINLKDGSATCVASISSVFIILILVGVLAGFIIKKLDLSSKI